MFAARLVICAPMNVKIDELKGSVQIAAGQFESR